MLLYTEWLRPSVSFLLMGVTLVVTDIISTKDLLDGFANEQLAVIIMLLIISNMISQSGIVDRIFGFLSSKETISPKAFLFKMMSGVGISSAIFNNTPLVALFMPYVHNWCRRNNHSPSKFLIPLSYASILGGCVTLVGTSTNLIVNGLAMESGLPSLEILDFTMAGGVMFVVGFIYLYFFSDWLLPSKASFQDEAVENGREYFVETHITRSSKLIGKSVEDAGLRNLKGTYLIEIMRDGNIISPVSPKEILEEEDYLFFAGDAGAINDLRNPKLGLSLPKACSLDEAKSIKALEVVVAHNSRLIGKSIRESDFRAKYDGGIIAVHRNGERLEGKIGDIELKAGDLMLVLPGLDFKSRTQTNPGFYVLNDQVDEDNNDTPIWKPVTLILGLILAIGLSFADFPLFKSLAVLLAIGVIIQVSSPNRIRNSVDFNLLLIIAFGLGLGKAMIVSGAADQIMNYFDFGAAGDQAWYMLIVLFTITNLLAAFVTSKAAVAITLPLALQVITEHQWDPVPFVLIVAFGGAANFITPIGYQTNLMVYGPGRYNFNDFFKIGLPLTVIYGLVASLILAQVYNLM